MIDHPVQIEELTAAKAFAYFDAEARRLLNMSGGEFEKKWCAGDLGIDDAVAQVAMLFPGDQLGRRWEMARKLGCSPETVAVFSDALDAANRIAYRIENARRARVGDGS